MFHVIKKKSFNSLYIRMFSYLTLMVIIPIAFLGVCFYGFYFNNYIRNFSETYNIKLKHISASIISTLSMIENTVLQSKNDSIFYDYKRMITPGEYVKELQDVSKKLRELKRTCPVVESVYFYDPYSGAIITNAYGSYNVDEFYDTAWITDFDYNHELKRYSLRLNKNREYLSTNSTNVLLFTPTEYVITIAGKDHVSRLLAININASKLSKQISNSFGLHDENFCLIDEQGLIILNSNVKKIGRYIDIPFPDIQTGVHSTYYKTDESYVFYHHMSYNNLTGIFIIPKSVIFESFTYFIYYILILCATLLLVCMFLAFVITKKMYSPMKNLILSINKFGNFEDAYNNENVKDIIDIFRMIFNQLHGDKEILQNKITIYENSVRNYTFRNYLEEKEDLDNLMHTFNELKLNINGKYFEFIMMSIPINSIYYSDNYTCKEAINRLNVIDVLDSYISSITVGLFFDIEKNIYMAFITSEDLNSLKKIEDNIIEVTKDALGIDLNVGISNSSNDLNLLISTFHQGLKAIKYANFFDIRRNNVLYSEISSIRVDNIQDPSNLEVGILKNIVFKNTTDSIKCIKEMTEFIKQVKDMDFAFEIFNKILSAIDKEFPLCNIGEYEPFQKIAKMNTLKDIEEYFIYIVRKIISDLINSEEKENCYCTLAKQYINEHACDIINATDIAEHINISYPYLSKLFKEQTGTNVLDYLNMVRIEKCKDMLRNTNENLQTISEAVGYNNIQSFQRFFKKFEHLTPGEYRKIHQNTR